tara:strand:+ start:526 stop:1170 length:645 start_codon:yes stop_codon:yes gene_type:complete
MANDNLRSGPLGATAQASKLGHRIVQMVPADNASVSTAAGAAAVATIDASSDRLVVKATANNHAFVLPNYEAACFGGNWIVEKVMVYVHTTFGATNNMTFDLGLYYGTVGATLTEVDADAIIDGFTILQAVGAAGRYYDVPLNGVGGSFESYKTAAGNTVSMEIGNKVSKFTAADADVTGANQQLVLTNTTSLNAGKYAVYVVLKPVGGDAFKK